MKAFGFLALLALMWPIAIEAQLDPQFDFYFEAQSSFDNWVKSVNEQEVAVDTMTIEEAIFFRQTTLSKPEFKQHSDFVLTRTKYSADGFNQGLYWPDGKIIPLPAVYLPDFVTLEKRETGVCLSYVTKDDNGGYSIHYLPLSIEVSGVLPREITIEVLHY